MFTGIGGFEYGLLKSNINHRLVGYSEIDQYAIKIFEEHFKGVKNYGNATKIDGSELPDFDFFVGGFPCQAFSNAGLREGFNDSRGNLFFDIARVLHKKQPKYFLLENVKGLLYHDQGRTFQEIRTILGELGYEIEWRIYNSKNFGVAQNRERIFIKGYLGNGSTKKIFFIKKID